MIGFAIQRVPRGLGTVLSTFGGQTPKELEEKVAGTLDLLQFYAQSSRVGFSAANAALAEGGQLTIGPVPVGQFWIFLQGHVRTVKTATMTALRHTYTVGGVSESWEGGPFGATETGPVVNRYLTPYPYLLVPGDQIQVTLSILGTDPTADVSMVAQVGVLG